MNRTYPWSDDFQNPSATRSRYNRRDQDQDFSERLGSEAQGPDAGDSDRHRAPKSGNAGSDPFRTSDREPDSFRGAPSSHSRRVGYQVMAFKSPADEVCFHSGSGSGCY